MNMPEIVDFEFMPASQVKWSAYADGNAWKLIQGSDYHSPTANARAAAGQWGKRNGYSIQTMVVEEGFLLRFTKRA